MVKLFKYINLTQNKIIIFALMLMHNIRTPLFIFDTPFLTVKPTNPPFHPFFRSFQTHPKVLAWVAHYVHSKGNLSLSGVTLEQPQLTNQVSEFQFMTSLQPTEVNTDITLTLLHVFAYQRCWQSSERPKWKRQWIPLKFLLILPPGRELLKYHISFQNC